jgi:hypothetical protein
LKAGSSAPERREEPSNGLQDADSAQASEYAARSAGKAVQLERRDKNVIVPRSERAKSDHNASEGAFGKPLKNQL